MPSASTDISGSSQTYTLTLSKSGTSWTLTATHSGSASYGAWGTATGTVTGASASPSSYSKGYDFRNYNSLTVASGTCDQSGTITATFNGNNSPYIGSGSVSVTEQPSSYSHYIYYNANGGSGEPSTTNAGSTTTKNSFSGKVSATIPTRTNYAFLGWATTSSATAAVYQPNTTYTFSSQNVTLYAVWKTYTHTVTYNANGGSNPPSSQSKSTDTQNSFTITLSASEPTRTGYSFLGWATSNSAASPSYYPNTEYTFNSQNVTLYAVWKAFIRYKLSDQWENGRLWYRDNGEWAEGQMKKKVSDTWR